MKTERAPRYNPTFRLAFVVDNATNNVTRYVANGGLGATGGYQFGKRIKITGLWCGAQPHLRSVDAALTVTVYKATSTTAATVVLNQNDAVAWTPISASVDVGVIFEADEYFGLRITANNAVDNTTDPPTWYRPTAIVEYEELG